MCGRFFSSTHKIPYMIDQRVLTICLILSLAGLMLVSYALESIEPPLTSVCSIQGNWLEKNVHLRGRVTSVNEFSGGSTVFTLEDNCSIKVYLPYNTATKINKTLEDREVDLIGVVQVYKGELEVVIEKPGNIRVK